MTKTNNEDSKNQYTPSLKKLDCLLKEKGFDCYGTIIKNSVKLTEEDVKKYANMLRKIHGDCPNFKKIKSALELLSIDENGPEHNGHKFMDYLHGKNVTIFSDKKFILSCCTDYLTLKRELGSRSRCWEKEVGITDNGWMANGAALLLGVQIFKLTNGSVFDIYTYSKNKDKKKGNKNEKQPEKEVKINKKKIVKERKEKLKKRITQEIYKCEETFELNDVQKKEVEKRVQIEHKQELACMGWLGPNCISQQRFTYPDTLQYVIPDVMEINPENDLEEMKLDSRLSTPTGIPWEVKDADRINSVEHALGQGIFQRHFTNSNRNSFWLFTKQLSGIQNFELLCKFCGENVEKIVLAKLIEPFDCETVTYEESKNLVIAVYNKGKIKWLVDKSEFEKKEEKKKEDNNLEELDDLDLPPLCAV